MNTDRPNDPPAKGGFKPLPSDPFQAGDTTPKVRPAQPGSRAPAPDPAPQPAPEPTQPEATQTPEVPVDHAGRASVCPYCASTLTNVVRCDACKGMLDPLSRQASQNAMGPWAVLDPSRPGVPGCSFDTLKLLIERGRVTEASIIRGPTTRQFWTRADHAPGVSVLLGVCHACKVTVTPAQATCASCQAELHVAPEDRQHLGLSPISALPGENVGAPRAVTPTSVPQTSAASSELHRLHTRTRVLVGTILGLTMLLLVLGAALGWQVLEKRGVKVSLPGTAGTSSTSPPGTASTGTTTQQPAGAGMTQTPATSAGTASANRPVDPDINPSELDDEMEPVEIALLGLDPALEEWHDDLRRVAALEREDTLAAMDRAVQLASTVLDEAGRGLDDAAGRFPVLRAWVARLKERADRMFAESVLGG